MVRDSPSGVKRRGGFGVRLREKEEETGGVVAASQSPRAPFVYPALGSDVATKPTKPNVDSNSFHFVTHTQREREGGGRDRAREYIVV